MFLLGFIAGFLGPTATYFIVFFLNRRSNKEIRGPISVDRPKAIQKGKLRVPRALTDEMAYVREQTEQGEKRV